MAELLVRVSRKIGATPAHDAKLTKRGDVIVVAPDGWGWSDIECTNPEWRIFKWPNISLPEASALLTPELPIAQDDASNPLLQRRGFGLDVDGLLLPPPMKAYIADDSRAAPAYTIPLLVLLTSIKIKKARR